MMRNSLADVVAAALRVLDAQGLENCSMRRVATELGVQPSALYHHVSDKQTLLALMADVIVGSIDGANARALCVALREAMLSIRDGADVVATAAAFRLGASAVEERLTGFVGSDGARTLLLYTFGHAQSTQTHLQAAALGALVDPPSAMTSDALDASFVRGLDIVLRGLDAEGYARPGPRAAPRS